MSTVYRTNAEPKAAPVEAQTPVVYRKWSSKWHEWQYDPLCTPDSEPLYAAPKALEPSREVIGRYMADKGFYLSKEALDGLMLKLEGIGGTP